MTAPALNRFDAARAELDAEWRSWVEEAQSPPTIEVYDKDWMPVGHARLVIEGDVEDTKNGAGEGRVRLYGEDPIARWMADDLPEASDVHLRVSQGANVWTGKAHTIDEEMDDSGIETVTWEGLHDWQHAKKVYCYPNPWQPAQFQWPKIYIWYGPAKFGISQLLHVNLIRRFQPGFIPFPDNFSPASYARMNIDDWAQIVDPRGLDHWSDTSMHTIIVTRMGRFDEIVKPILEDAGLMLKATRWLPGDPQPFPEHATLRLPTLIWSVVETGGVRGATGSMLDGFVQLVRSIAIDGITETTEAVPYDPPVEYMENQWGTKVASPAAVFYRAQQWTKIEGSGQVGVSRWNRRVHKALGHAILTGGKSPGWLNTGIKMLVNAALGWIGMIFMTPGLTLGLLDDQVEDVVLAFWRHKFGNRAEEMGRDSYGEVWETTGSTGFSISTIAAVRAGANATKPYTSYELEIVNGAPYMVGRHIDLGDPVSAEIGRSGRIYTDELRTKRTEFDASGVRLVIAIGVDSEEKSAAARLGRLLESVKQVTQALAVQS